MPKGGKRAGAGRPPFGLERMEHTSIRISADDRRRLEALGNGRISEGVRWLLREWQARTQAREEGAK